MLGQVLIDRPAPARYGGQAGAGPCRPGPIHRVGALATLLVCALLLGPGWADEGLAGFQTAELRILTEAGQTHAFTVYLAISPSQRARGLSFVRQLPKNRGMLFLFPPGQTIVMWMKDTFIPLDMVFMDAEGRVLQIEHDTTPHSLRRIVADPRASGVLELNAGMAERLGIRPGSRLLSSVIAPQP
jgi:hypothetical protein